MYIVLDGQEATRQLAMTSLNQILKTLRKTQRKPWIETNGLKSEQSNVKTTNSITRASNSNLIKGPIKEAVITPTKPKATNNPLTLKAANLTKVKCLSSSFKGIITNGVTPLINRISSNTGTTIKTDTSDDYYN